ncbi:MAG TPA: HipA domain-containing protein [Azonexus sp.]|nr:HipA domain-containing protein [Azonexus sp.]
MDKFGVIWTRYGGQPCKLADMVLTPSELRITKHPDAVGLPGPSLIHDKLGISTIEYKRDQWRHLPPQLEALLPPSNRDNPQRVILSKLLSRHIDTRGMPIIEQEWEMLLFAGRNGIGHLDVFPSDQIAERIYAKAPLPTIKASAASDLWATFKRIAEDTAKDNNEIDEIVQAIGPTPGISGFNPKLFVGLDMQADQWSGGISPSTGLQAIVKVESERYPGLLPLEALAYDIHNQARIPTPKYWLREIDFEGEKFPILAIERFDRAKNGTPIPLESVFSLLRTGSPTKFYDTTDGTMEDVWNAIKYVTANQINDRFNLFSRFTLALLTGNGDLHLENWSMLGCCGSVGLSPVYDPAPMRAYRAFRSNHDLLSALPFSGIGGTGNTPYASSGEIPADLGSKLVQFGEYLGLANRTCRTRLAELLELSTDYPEKAIAMLESIPIHRRKQNAPDIAGFEKTLAELHKSLSTGL